MQHMIESHLDTSRFQTIADVQAALEILEHDLPRLQLDLIRNFNAVYTIITKRVRQAIAQNEFRDPAFMNRFDIRFAGYYFTALKSYLGGHAVPPAWDKAFRSAERGSVSPFMAMILGVNAHITNDIPQVLRDCQADQRHYRDYRHVNHVISRSLDEAIDSLAADTHLLSPQRQLLRPLYKPVMRLLVIRWRSITWRRYQHLLRQHMDIPEIERRAGQNAGWLNKLPV